VPAAGALEAVRAREGPGWVRHVGSGRALQTLPATSSTRGSKPHFLTRMPSYDAASIVWQALGGGGRGFVSRAPHPSGRALQVDLMKPISKAPSNQRLKLKYDKMLSILLQFCFQFQLALPHPGARGGPAHGGLVQVETCVET
jgi:hypothetical protein